MSDLLMDSNSELVIRNGDFVLTSDDRESVSQHIRQRLRTFKGEWFLDKTIGLPFLGTIMEKNPNSQLVAGIFKDTILGTPGVTRLNKYEQTLDTITRKLSIAFAVVIVTGEVIFFEEQF